MIIKIRCPVCNGSGAVEGWVASGQPGCDIGDGLMSYVSNELVKVCPACNGTGMQETRITDYPIMKK